MSNLQRYGICGGKYCYAATDPEGQFVLASAAEAEIARLREENRMLRTSREGWAARSKADFDRLGKALESVRRKRPNGEPARSDGHAVEELVAELARKDELLKIAKVGLEESRGYIDAEIDDRYPPDEFDPMNGYLKDTNPARVALEKMRAYPESPEGSS